MATDRELAEQAEAHLKATTVSYPEWVRRKNAGKYTPKDGSTTEWGKAFIALDKIDVGPPPTDPFALPPPPGDVGGMPDAPINPTTTNITSTLTVSTAITDRVFNVTGQVSEAINVVAGGSLTRCVLNCNGLIGSVAIRGNDGVGKVGDVRLNGQGAPWGFFGCDYTGNCYVTRAQNGFRLSGGGTLCPAGVTLFAFDCNGFGFIAEHLTNATFLGLLQADYTGGTSTTAQGTAFSTWQNIQNATFAYIRGTRSNGYGVAIVKAIDSPGAVSGVRVNAAYVDGAGASADSDPGIVVTGGTTGTTVDQIVVKNHTYNGVSEADHMWQIRREQNVTFGTIDVYDCAYNGFRVLQADNVTVGKLRLTNCGTVQPDWIAAGAVQIGQTPAHYLDGTVNAVATNVQIGEFIQVAGSSVPKYAIDIGSQSTGQIASGQATSWAVAKTQNLAGAGFTVNVS